MISSAFATREEAVAFRDTKWWEGKTPLEIAHTQINERRWVLPDSDPLVPTGGGMDIFLGALTAVMGMPITIAALGMNTDRIQAEVNRQWSAK